MHPTRPNPNAHQNKEVRTITVSVNDKPHTLAASTTLTQLLDQLGLGAGPGVAVAVNAAVVPRAAWLTHRLADGNQVLLIQATQGG